MLSSTPLPPSLYAEDEAVTLPDIVFDTLTFYVNGEDVGDDINVAHRVAAESVE